MQKEDLPSFEEDEQSAIKQLKMDSFNWNFEIQNKTFFRHPK
jgi:hypothetical protein